MLTRGQDQSQERGERLPRWDDGNYRILTNPARLSAPHHHTGITFSILKITIVTKVSFSFELIWFSVVVSYILHNLLNFLLFCLFVRHHLPSHDKVIKCISPHNSISVLSPLVALEISNVWTSTGRGSCLGFTQALE